MLNERFSRISVNLDYHKILVYSLILLAFPFLIFSLSKVYTSVTPTLYMLLFSYSLFFILGLVYFYNIDKNAENRNHAIGLINNSHYISLQKLACILFFLLIFLVFIDLNNRIYIKGVLYYLLISIASSLLGLQILALNDMYKSFRYIILLQIIILGSTIRSSSFIINSYLLGADTYWHYNVIKTFIILRGHLDLYAQHYFYFPSYHLSQAIGELIMGPGEFSFNLINLSHSIILILICYLIGRSLSGEKTGLICALIFSIATPVLSLLVNNTSKIGGVTLALLCIYLIISIYKRYDIKLIALLIFIAFPTAIWHPELLFFLVALMCANIAVLFYKSDFKVTISKKYLIIFLFFTTALAFYYFYSYFNWIDVLRNPNKASPQLTQIIPSNNVGNYSFLQLFMSYLGVTFLVFFAPYYLFDKRNKMNNYLLALLLTLIILHILPFLSIISGIFALNPERVFNYVQIILLILMANVITNIFDVKKLRHAILFIIIFSLFTFSSVSTYLISDGNDVFNDAIPKGTTYVSASTLAVHDFLSKTPLDARISSDIETIRYVSNPIRGLYGLENRKIAYFPSVEQGYLLLNSVNLRRLNWEYTDWGKLIIKNNSSQNIIYDNNVIKLIYY